MGLHKIEISAVGGHGCDRSAKQGEKLYSRCNRMTCPDCLAADFVARLQRLGFMDVKAAFTHWPGDPSEVVDDLVSNTRIKGQFQPSV